MNQIIRTTEIIFIDEDDIGAIIGRNDVNIIMWDDMKTMKNISELFPIRIKAVAALLQFQGKGKSSVGH